MASDSEEEIVFKSKGFGKNPTIDTSFLPVESLFLFIYFLKDLNRE